MERKDFTTIGDVLRQCLEQSQMQGHLDEVRACDIWRQILGDDIASKCHRPTAAKGIMTVRIPNAALRNELHMQRGAIIRAINETLGKNVITQLRLIS